MSKLVSVESREEAVLKRRVSLADLLRSPCILPAAEKTRSASEKTRSLPAAPSKALVGVRLVPVPCATIGAVVLATFFFDGIACCESSVNVPKCSLFVSGD